MSFSSFRNKVRWVALICAAILFSLEMYCRVYCYQIVISSGGHPFKLDHTPSGFTVVWLHFYLSRCLPALLLCRDGNRFLRYSPLEW